MYLVCASDSFKGSLSSSCIAELVGDAARAVWGDVRCRAVLLADGGEGTVEALIAATGGRRVHCQVQGPLGVPVEAHYGLLPDGSAIIEVAAATGLPLVPEAERDPLRASSCGTGQLILDAIERGARRITLAIGGSATNDGGMGMLSALGVRFFDGHGDELAGCGAELERVASLDSSNFDAQLAGVQLNIMCDVDNPLLGRDGATYTFGPQKGATAEQLELLERGMAHYATLVEKELGCEVKELPGSGAAGGLGFALKAFAGAALAPGIEQILELIGFDAILKGADLCVTGEGRFDGQTSHGKVAAGVAARCQAAGVPCAAIVGFMTEDARPEELGICEVEQTKPAKMDLAQAIEQAKPLYRAAAKRLFMRLKHSV